MATLNTQSALIASVPQNTNVKIQYTLPNGDQIVGSLASFPDSLDLVQNFCVADAADMFDTL